MSNWALHVCVCVCTCRLFDLSLKILICFCYIEGSWREGNWICEQFLSFSIPHFTVTVSLSVAYRLSSSWPNCLPHLQTLMKKKNGRGGGGRTACVPKVSTSIRLLPALSDSPLLSPVSACVSVSKLWKLIAPHGRSVFQRKKDSSMMKCKVALMQ